MGTNMLSASGRSDSPPAYHACRARAYGASQPRLPAHQALLECRLRCLWRLVKFCALRDVPPLANVGMLRASMAMISFRGYFGDLWCCQRIRPDVSQRLARDRRRRTTMPMRFASYHQ